MAARPLRRRMTRWSAQSRRNWRKGFSACRTDEKYGDRRDDEGCAEEEVKLRRQPAVIEQRAACERREYCSKAADADRPPHAGGSHGSGVERRPDGIEAGHRRVRDDAE